MCKRGSACSASLCLREIKNSLDHNKMLVLKNLDISDIHQITVAVSVWEIEMTLLVQQQACLSRACADDNYRIRADP